MERTTCCVVGGGPAGMMLGLLLARAGVEVTVLEKHRDFLRDFRGDTVHPSTLRLLDELGLGERFARLPSRRLGEMRMLIGDATVVAADFRHLPGRHKYIAMVPQWDFLDLLASAAAEEPSFTLRMGTPVTGLLTEGGRGRVFARFGGGQAAVTMDRGDYYQTSYLIAKGRDAELRSNDIQWLRNRLGGLFGWDGGVTEAIRSWDDVKLLDVTMGRLPRWYADGLLCIGDAAHVMSPVGGVGVNLAVQDAVAAARILARPLRRGTVGVRDLARVRRRWLPMAVTQKSQRGEHEMLLRPALDGTLSGDRLPVPLRLLRRIPALRAVTAYVGGVGVRPEHAPPFARARR
ncbi:FAD-dependent oxidoreductase [Streptomyces sparsogenes]|uniref:FAD-dependent oxidoreductase n=1 Tax=Streptomyces sparsogenes TaxID=67365 RepID=UPI00340BD7C9